jgi:FkbM family methyltransferase
MQLCSKSKVIFDIGANTGIYSLIAQTLNPDAEIYAFEPMERVFEKLKKNIALNNFTIIPVRKAISDKDGMATIYPTNAEHTYSVTVNKNLSSPETSVIATRIETVSLNSFIRETNISKIDLMKIDVETHEPEVLEGFLDYLSLFKPTFLIEVLNDEIGNKIYDIVKNLGYLYFNIDEKGSINQVERITKSDFYNYLLCNREIAEALRLIEMDHTV